MRKIKKPIAFLLVLAVLTLFSGYNGRVKIRDRVIIQEWLSTPKTTPIS